MRSLFFASESPEEGVRALTEMWQHQQSSQNTVVYETPQSGSRDVSGGRVVAAMKQRVPMLSGEPVEGMATPIFNYGEVQTRRSCGK